MGREGNEAVIGKTCHIQSRRDQAMGTALQSDRKQWEKREKLLTAEHY
jgi:hypothetical protein